MVSLLKVNRNGSFGCCMRLIIMIIHENTLDSYVYVCDKQVYVCAYTRRRFDKMEHVRQHYRNYPKV